MSDTKDKKNENSEKGSSDGFVGNQRIRTFFLGGLLLAFCILSAAYQMDTLSGLNKTIKACNDFNLPCGDSGTLRIAYLLIVIGIVLIFIFSAMAIIVHCVQKCANIEKVIGFGLTIGGIFYFIGMLIRTSKSGYTGAYFMVFIGEGFLPAVCAIYLGLDAMQDFLGVETKRLFWNLLLLAIVSGLCCTGYSDFAQYSDWAAVISTGYAIVFVASIVYLILYICDCITCNCDDNPLVRLIIAGALIFGGVFCAFGYYGILGPTNGGSVWSYNVGYTILFAGNCIVWGLDMGLKDKLPAGK